MGERFHLEELRPGEAVFRALRIRRTDEGNLEITIRLTRKGGETTDELIRPLPGAGAQVTPAAPGRLGPGTMPVPPRLPR